MPEPKQLSPLLDGLEFGAEVQKTDSKSMHLLRDPKNGTVFLLRIFTIPENQNQLDALIYSGAVSDRAEAMRYYTDQILELRRELEAIKALGEFDGIQAQIGYQIEELPEEAGFEVYVLSNYLPTLNQHLSLNNITKLEALNMALDLCDALFTVHENGHLVKNIHPDNILITPNNRFVLANLSLAELDRLAYHSISQNELSEYSAPELFGIVPNFQPNSDLYSLGMVLYYVFNGSHNAFVDERTTQIAANKKRLEGEQLPVPLFADYELSEILLKACAFDPAERYQAPEELKQALTLYMQRNPVSDEPILPPIVSEPEDVVDTEAPEEDEPISFTSAEELDKEFVAHLSPDLESSGEDDLEQIRAEEQTQEEPSNDESASVNGKRVKKRKKVWIPVTCAVVAVAALTAGYLYFNRPETIVISGLRATESSFCTITASMDKPETETPLTIVCSDAYGNIQRKPFTGEDVVFEELLPGAQYSITVEVDGDTKATLLGSTSTNCTTTPTATLNSISVSDLTANSVTLQLGVSGAVPSAWIIRCSSTGMEDMEHTFSGNSIDITGLRSNTTYTCTFADASGAPVNGETSVTFTTEPSLTLESFEVTHSSAKSVTLSWSYSGDLASSWTIRCEGSNGDTIEEQVSGLSTTFDDLATDMEYTFTISTVGMEPSELSTLHVSTIQARITELSAESRESDSISLLWDAVGVEEEAVWTVHYKISGSSEEETIQTTEHSLLLENLIPQSSYTIELRDGDDNVLAGESTTFVRTVVPERFTSYGTDSLYSALWLKPDGDNWNINNLRTTRTSFSSDEGIVLAIQSISGIQNWNADVNVRYVIRNADNRPVSTSFKTVAWNELWSNNLLLDVAPETPANKGHYQLEIYINSALLTTIEFEIQ